MKSSQFMDKQIMDLSSSSSPPPSTDFIDLINNKITNNNSHDDDDQQKQKQQHQHQHQHQHQIGDNNELESKKEVPIVPSYDFQPIRPYTAGGLSHSALDLAGSTTVARAWSMNDPKPNSNSSNRGFGNLDSIEPAKLVPEKAPDMSIMMSEIDKTVKKHTDTLLHVMEGVSARLTQLEGRTHDLENLVDDLKVSVESNHGSTDGKMRKLENILLEVRSGVQNLKDKQDIIEAQLQLSKLTVDQHPKTNSLHLDPTTQPPAPVPNPPMQQMPQFPVTSFPQPPSSSSAPPSQQILQPPSSQLLTHLPSQFPLQQEPYSHSQPPPPPNQRPYQAPPQSQRLPPPHQPPYQPPPQQPQYPQQPPPQSLGYNNPEEQPPYPKQSYMPNPASSAPSQQFYNAPQPPQPSMYDGAGGRSNSGFPSGYSSEPYPYTGSPKPAHMSSSGTGGYPQLSNSRPLPHALPMASAVNSSGSNSPRSEGRVPLEDVIDRVTTMGFPRNQVRETVRKLTDNGQAVDLNVVLDKLMNPGGGGGGAPPEGWFGGQPF